ncbi:phosphatase PAP2 family protein [Opitutus sp. GAS368]|jgi:acid phosphatase (class A)|uniref:phosphatase PAP2 family protein n=1 Tax=Opitutus sp. GAS368 TaxID=1882749 RepID=UPI00087B33C8|nr:phosphatase PAP2 family protein [Opitutus sp. GAS368]SDR80022.1 acid phosphatase (class A) [Opitutus sp. GAS368]
MKLTTRLLVALAFVLAARAADPAAPEYFNAAGFDWRAVVSPPPADDSVAGRADQEMVVQLDLHRTPEQVVLAKHYEKSLDEFTFMAPVLGEWCTAEALPRTRAFFRQANAETRPVIDAAKTAWNRPRPYIFNPDLHPAVEKPNNASYPSGHAYTSSWMAALLSATLPEFAHDWERQAALIRWSRLVGGAHYPADVTAGKILGEAVARDLLKSPKLQHDLEEVRAELRAHLHKKAA